MKTTHLEVALYHEDGHANDKAPKVAHQLRLERVHVALRQRVKEVAPQEVEEHAARGGGWGALGVGGRGGARGSAGCVGRRRPGTVWVGPRMPAGAAAASTAPTAHLPPWGRPRCCRPCARPRAAAPRGESGAPPDAGGAQRERHHARQLPARLGVLLPIGQRQLRSGGRRR
jgi:hypothetical protein